MNAIPIHKASEQSGAGIFLKEISPSLPKEPVKYPHQDDYYLFGMINGGTCRVSLDFKEYQLSKNEVICSQPGQVHHFLDASDLKAYFLFLDSAFIDSTDKQIIAEYALYPTRLAINEMRHSELNQIFTILARRMNNLQDNCSKRIARNLAGGIVAMITEAIGNTREFRPGNRRQLEITLAFKELLSREIDVNRRPSHYAELLHLSPVYLNEVVKNVTGTSTSKYIQNETMLRAKRMLVYTTRSIQEIALDLGFDDYAYFTRLFTKSTGVSPSSYRKKHLE